MTEHAIEVLFEVFPSNFLQEAVEDEWDDAKSKTCFWNVKKGCGVVGTIKSVLFILWETGRRW